MRYALILYRCICHVSVLLLGIACGDLLFFADIYAQTPIHNKPVPILGQQPEVTIPGFWGSEEWVKKPDIIGARVLRFLTDDEFPPLHFAGSDGQPTGFSVELARAACAILNVTCTVQVRKFDTLLDSLSENRGDVIAAAIPIRPALYNRFITTRSYLRTPARFATHKSIKAKADKDVLPTPIVLAGKRVAVVRGSAHEAYLTAFFPKAEQVQFSNLQDAEEALRSGKASYLFADGMSLSLWLNGTAAAGCCEFVGGPYPESKFFGEGVGFILRKEDAALRDALNYALRQLWENGTYAEIYLRHFPISYY